MIGSTAISQENGPLAMQRRQVGLCRQLDNVSPRLHPRHESAHLEVVALSIEQHLLTVEAADAFEIIWRP